MAKSFPREMVAQKHFATTLSFSPPGSVALSLFHLDSLARFDNSFKAHINLKYSENLISTSYPLSLSLELGGCHPHSLFFECILTIEKLASEFSMDYFIKCINVFNKKFFVLFSRKKSKVCHHHNAMGKKNKNESFLLVMRLFFILLIYFHNLSLPSNSFC